MQCSCFIFMLDAIRFGDNFLIRVPFTLHSKYGLNETFEFSHHTPVNEFTEFGEFLLDTDGEITTCGQCFIHYLWKFTISGTSLFILVVSITCVRQHNLTIWSQHCTYGTFLYIGVVNRSL